MTIRVKLEADTNEMLKLLEKINEEQARLQEDIFKLGSMISAVKLKESGDSKESPDQN